ncbi:hypothetical protein ACF3MZ_23865 [Paenibacillaceae bacterium WGS1546]|uniref:hypothetical protein n=1 Tax=Cohnella sp. WGS1546 TaxID=3366810 RepID=UPI00372D5B48
MPDTKEQIKLFGAMHSEVVKKMIHKRYYYNSTATYLNALFNEGGITRANKIYWDEILLRAHFASVTSIMRNEKWLNGLVLSIDTSNYIIFAASLRGFLESATDSYYSLNTPLDLACNFKNIKLAVNGNLNRLLQSDTLEEKLIHFQHAAKSDSSGLPYNKPLYASKYIELFDQYGDVNTKELYVKLCEVVHPAKDSISCFTTTITESENFEYSITDTSLDVQNIDGIINEYSFAIINLLKMSINAPILCLRILNYFDYELVKSEYLDSCLINELVSKDVWAQVMEMVEESHSY